MTTSSPGALVKGVGREHDSRSVAIKNIPHGAAALAAV